jgi:Mn2+/Fe2+ NRAMP family transporter
VAEQAWEALPEVAEARLEVTEVAAALRLTREVVAAVLVVVSHDLASNSETRISDHDRKNVDAVAAMTSRTFAVVVVAYVVSSYSSVAVVDYSEAFVVVHDVGLVGEAVGVVEAGLADCCRPQADSCSCWRAWGCPWWRLDS